MSSNLAFGLLFTTSASCATYIFYNESESLGQELRRSYSRISNFLRARFQQLNLPQPNENRDLAVHIRPLLKAIKSIAFKSNHSPFELLCPDTLSLIASFLPLEDQLTFRKVCKKWHACFASSSLREITKYEENVAKHASELILKKDVLTTSNLAREHLRTLLTSKVTYALAGRIFLMCYGKKMMNCAFYMIDCSMHSTSSSLEYVNTKFPLLGYLVAAPLLYAIFLRVVEAYEIASTIPAKTKNRLLHNSFEHFLEVKDICGHTFNYFDLSINGDVKCHITKITLRPDEVFFDHQTFKQTQKFFKKRADKNHNWLHKLLNGTNPLLQHCIIPEDSFLHLETQLNRKLSIDFLNPHGIRSIADLKALTIDTKLLDELDMIKWSLQILPQKFKKDLKDIDLSKISLVTSKELKSQAAFAEFCVSTGRENMLGEYHSILNAFIGAGELGIAMTRVLRLKLDALRKIEFSTKNKEIQVLSKFFLEIEGNLDYCIQLLKHFSDPGTQLTEPLSSLHDYVAEIQISKVPVNLVEACCEKLIILVQDIKTLERKRLNELLDRYLQQPGLLEFWEKVHPAYSLSILKKSHHISLDTLFKLSSLIQKSPSQTTALAHSQ